MDTDNRKHPRFNPKGLIANIIIDHASDEELALEGIVEDMSYSGIKIKLSSAECKDIPEGKIKINMTMPQSGIPITISGEIKHWNEQSGCGLQYANNHTENDVDDLMFECIKCA